MHFIGDIVTMINLVPEAGFTIALVLKWNKTLGLLGGLEEKEEEKVSEHASKNVIKIKTIFPV